MLKTIFTAAVLLTGTATLAMAQDQEALQEYSMLKLVPLYAELCEIEVPEATLSKIEAAADALQEAAGATDEQTEAMLTEMRTQSETSPPNCEDGSSDRKPFDELLAKYSGE